MTDRTTMRRKLRDLHIIKATDHADFERLAESLEVCKELTDERDYAIFTDLYIYGRTTNELIAKYGKYCKWYFYDHARKVIELLVKVYENNITRQDL